MILRVIDHYKTEHVGEIGCQSHSVYELFYIRSITNCPITMTTSMAVTISMC